MNIFTLIGDIAVVIHTLVAPLPAPITEQQQQPSQVMSPLPVASQPDAAVQVSSNSGSSK